MSGTNDKQETTKKKQETMDETLSYALYGTIPTLAILVFVIIYCCCYFCKKKSSLHPTNVAPVYPVINVEEQQAPPPATYVIPDVEI